MQRRTLLKLGLVSGAVLALAGGAAMLLQPGLVQGRLSDAGRGLFISAGRAILQGTLPQDAGAQQQALQGMADRVDALAQNLPPHVQAELSQLVGLLCTSAGRRGLAGLSSDWLDADPAQVLSDTAIRGKDLDEQKANEAQKAAEEALKNAKGELDIARAQSELAVMAAQIAALRKFRQKR